MSWILDRLELDPVHTAREIGDLLQAKLQEMAKDGILIGLSGGLDSAIVATLCVKALGKDKATLLKTIGVYDLLPIGSLLGRTVREWVIRSCGDWKTAWIARNWPSSVARIPSSTSPHCGQLSRPMREAPYRLLDNPTRGI